MTDLENAINRYSEIPSGTNWNWVRAAVVVWKPYKDKDIVHVHRLLVYELPDRNGEWTGEFTFSETYEAFNQGEYRIGGGYRDLPPTAFDARLKSWQDHPKLIEAKIIIDQPLLSIKTPRPQ